MKKFFLILAVVAMVLPGCKKIEESIDALENRIDKLEQSIPTIDEQIESIQTSVEALEEVDKSLDESIKALEANDEATAEEIATLKETDKAIEAKIEELKKYVDEVLKSTKDWVSATFATLEQLNALSSEVATLKSLVDANKAEAAANLATAITNLETSLKSWVGEQLSNYYTIAEIDAKIAELQKAIADGDAALQEELNNLKSQLETAKKELTEAYKKAIEEAITENNGVINAKIASEIAAVNKRIDEAVAAINAKIAALQVQVDKNSSDIAKLLARIQSVSYVPQYSDGKATVKCAEGVSRVTLDFEISPKDVVVELAEVWQDAISVKAIYTETRAVSFIDMPIVKFESDETNGVITVTASGENLSAEFYTDLQEASLRLEISDGNNDKLSEYIPIVPQRWCNEGIPSTPANNEIYYISSDCNVINPYLGSSDFGAPLVSNLYDWQKGCFVLKFDGDITKIGQFTFGALDENIENAFATLKYFAMPNSVTAIGANAFRWSGLVSIVIPDSVTRIYGGAFGACQNLISVHLGSGITNLGEYLFSRCSKLEDVNIPEQTTTIPRCCFNGCSSLTSITIPDSVTSIGKDAFIECSSLTSVNLGKNIESIDGGAFENCSSLEKIVLPNKLTTIGDWAFNKCNKLKTITIPESVTMVGEAVFATCPQLEYIYGKFASADNRCLVVDGRLIHMSSCVKGSYTLPDNVTMITKMSISYLQNVISLTIPESVVDCEVRPIVGSENIIAFYGKFATADNRALVKDGVLLAVAFYGLTEYVVPEGVTMVREYTFRSMSSSSDAASTQLTKIILPSTLKTIKYSAFAACRLLKEVYCKAITPPTLGSDVFDEINEIPTIYVPTASVDAYKVADGWKDYADYIVGYDF